MATIDDILASASLPEQTVSLCLNGRLNAEHQALDAELKAMGEFTQSHLGEADPRAPLAQRIADIEAQMAASETPFVFRALPQRRYRELLNAHPGEPSQRFNADTFPRELIAACCIDPALSLPDVDRLFDALNEGAVEVLFMAAFTVNEGLSRVPFSKAASAVTRRLEPKS